MDVGVIVCLAVACEEHGVKAQYYDSRTGEPIDGEKVQEARNEEMQERERRVYVVVDVDECWEKTGKAPIGVRWIDIYKGEGIADWLRRTSGRRARASTWTPCVPRCRR